MSVLNDRRRTSLSPELLARVFIAWIAICAILLAITIVAIATMPEGGAETVGVMTFPLITLGIALLLVGRIVWCLVGEEAAGLACLALALSVPALTQFMPLRIDDYGWQIVLALAAVNGMIARNPRRGGWIAGISLAMWLAISFEGLPMAVAFCGVVALRWLRNRHESGWLVHTLQGLAAGSTTLFFAARVLQSPVTACDALSPVHCAMFAFGAATATLLAKFEPMPRFALAAGFGLITAGMLAIAWLAAPQCVASGFADAGPPIWRESLGTALHILVLPIIGIIACLRLAGGTGDWLRRWWFEHALLLGYALIVALFDTRAGAVAGAVAAVPLGWQICEWMRSSRHNRRKRKKVAAMAAIALALVPAVPLTWFASAIPARAAQLLGKAQPR